VTCAWRSSVGVPGRDPSTDLNLGHPLCLGHGPRLQRIGLDWRDRGPERRGENHSLRGRLFDPRVVLNHPESQPQQEVGLLRTPDPCTPDPWTRHMILYLTKVVVLYEIRTTSKL
jgi:hypothetical protein